MTLKVFQSSESIDDSMAEEAEESVGANCLHGISSCCRGVSFKTCSGLLLAISPVNDAVE